MSQNDRAAVDSATPAQVNIDNVINDIHSDRERFTKENNINSAKLSNQMAKDGLLPTISIG
ncbi:MAG: hypothetical protein JST89_10405 [Cyanobacteria bacterium SZAS-4]|nr:hypothetical protein [Cyanobacteria bacterium SZAS-4]